MKRDTHPALTPCHSEGRQAGEPALSGVEGNLLLLAASTASLFTSDPSP